MKHRKSSKRTRTVHSYQVSFGQLQKSSCIKQDGTPKKQYPNAEIAYKVACNMSALHNIPYAPYKCMQCGKYHIGRRFKWDKINMNKKK